MPDYTFRCRRGHEETLFIPSHHPATANCRRCGDRTYRITTTPFGTPAVFDRNKRAYQRAKGR